MGAILPSQRFLISKMIAPVPADYEGEVVELGAGSGALTLRLARRCPAAAIRACEINASLASTTRRTLDQAGLADRVKVAAQSAQTLLEGLPFRPDFIISGIPLGNLERRTTLALIRQIHQRLAPGGLYIQFQHSLIDRQNIRSQFRSLRTLPAFLNLPPAFVYYARK
jgi:phospholipid N-methyltransferase